MNKEQIAKTAVGGALVGVGYGFKLAKWGLSVSEVVFNGAKNLTNSFVKAPELGIGNALFKGLQQQTGKIADTLIKAGKKYTR